MDSSSHSNRENAAVLVHGIAGPAASFDAFREHLRERELLNFADTISGHGLTSINRSSLHCADAMDGVRDIAHRVEHVRKEFGAKNITLGAFSMGAFYSLLYFSHMEQGGDVPPVDRAVFLSPAPIGLKPSIDVCKAHPIAYLSGVMRLRIDDILRSSREMFMGDDVPAGEQKKYFDALRPVSLRAYLQFMFPRILTKGFPKPGSLITPATIFRATRDRVCSKRMTESVQTLFQSDVPVQEFDTSHCGILHSKEAAEAFADLALADGSHQ